MTRTTSIGKNIRMPFIYDRSSPIIISPIDDYLIFGPRNGLEKPKEFLRRITSAKPDAILTHAGLVQSFSEYFVDSKFIINLTASTIRSNHAIKRLVHGVETALRLNASGVACHINLGSCRSSEMIEQAGHIVEEANRYDLPVLGIVYPRDDSQESDQELNSLRRSDPDEFSNLISHCASVGVSLGFDLIKLWYTGDARTFSTVVSAAGDVPVVIAGGELTSVDQAIEMAKGAISAGASGVSFGRNFFGHNNTYQLIDSIRRISIR